MAFNLDLLDQENREHWFQLPFPLRGMEVLVRYASPEYGEKFRRHLLTRGIHMQAGEKSILVPGRDQDYVLEFCKFYVQDWKGATRGENGPDAPYSPEALAKVLLKVHSAFEAVTGFISQEEAYFSENGSGPK